MIHHRLYGEIWRRTNFTSPRIHSCVVCQTVLMFAKYFISVTRARFRCSIPKIVICMSLWTIQRGRSEQMTMLIAYYRTVGEQPVKSFAVVGAIITIESHGIIISAGHLFSTLSDYLLIPHNLSTARMWTGTQKALFLSTHKKTPEMFSSPLLILWLPMCPLQVDLWPTIEPV